MKKEIQKRKVSLRYICLVSFISISLYSCIMGKHYPAKISKFHPLFWGEIKENNLKGIADTTVVFITGKVNNYALNAEEGIELIFLNKENNKEFKTITDSNGDFKTEIISGLYKLEIIPYEYGRTPTLNFENLNFKPGEIRELVIYTESSSETIAKDTIFKSKRAYNKYLKR